MDVPYVSIDSVSEIEGDDGDTPTVVFTIMLSHSCEADFSISYAVTDGTAKSAKNDYGAASGTATVSAGDWETTLGVTIYGDDKDEFDETFNVELSVDVDADGDIDEEDISASGTGTIIDDDDPPSLSIGDSSVVEGDPVADEDSSPPEQGPPEGTVYAEFEVTLSEESGKRIPVVYSVRELDPDLVNGPDSAEIGEDVWSAIGNLWIEEGETSATISVAILPDFADEYAEGYDVVVWDVPTYYTLADDIGAGTIIDNDPIPELSVNNPIVSEILNIVATFSITLTNPTEKEESGTFETKEASATELVFTNGAWTGDYIPVSKSYDLPHGIFYGHSTERKESSIIRPDQIDEGSEIFEGKVTVVGSNLNLVKDTGYATIVGIDLQVDGNGDGTIDPGEDDYLITIKPNPPEVDPTPAELNPDPLQVKIELGDTEYLDGFTVRLFGTGLSMATGPDMSGVIPSNTEYAIESVPSSIYVQGLAVESASVLAYVIEPNGVLAYASDSISVKIVDLDLDIDSDNNDGVGLPEGSDWEELLEDNKYGLGKLVMQNHIIPNPDFYYTPISIRLSSNIESNDPIRIRLDFEENSDAGQIILWTAQRDDLDSNGNFNGFRIIPGQAYSLSELPYFDGSNITLFIAGVQENPAIKTLWGVDTNGKPQQYITATLVRTAAGPAGDFDSDEVKYIVTQEDSFLHRLQFDGSSGLPQHQSSVLRNGLASRISYTPRDAPDYSLQLQGEKELDDLNILDDPSTLDDVRGFLLGTNSVPGFDLGLYRDYIADRYILAFAGTRDWPEDMINNVWQGLGWNSKQYPPAMQIADSLNSNPNLAGNFVITGQSMGGGLASAGAIVTGVHADTFNSSGLNKTTLYKRDANGILEVDDDGNYIEIYPGSVANYESGAMIDAYYNDFDILSTAQDYTYVFMPSALGNRIEVNGPHTLFISPFIPPILALLVQLDTVVSLPVTSTLLSALTVSPGIYYMVENHNSYLYGLLVTEANIWLDTIEEDLLGVPYLPPNG